MKFGTFDLRFDTPLEVRPCNLKFASYGLRPGNIPPDYPLYYKYAPAIEDKKKTCFHPNCASVCVYVFDVFVYVVVC